MFPPFLEINPSFPPPPPEKRAEGNGEQKPVEEDGGEEAATRLSIHTAATIPRSRFYDREFHRIP